MGEVATRENLGESSSVFSPQNMDKYDPRLTVSHFSG
jgi:hypothetical protein